MASDTITGPLICGNCERIRSATGPCRFCGMKEPPLDSCLNFSLVCRGCDAGGECPTPEAAWQAGWSLVITTAADLPQANFLGLCPECWAAEEVEEALARTRDAVRPATPEPEPLDPAAETVGPVPEDERFDFVNRFPRPTEAAKRELRADQHYPRPDDFDAVSAHFDAALCQWCDEVQAAQWNREEADRLRTTGIPENGKRKVRNALERALSHDQAARVHLENADGVIDEVSRIYGQVAADLFADYCRRRHHEATQAGGGK